MSGQHYCNKLTNFYIVSILGSQMCTGIWHILCTFLWIAWWWLFRVETCRCEYNLLINRCVWLSYTFYIIYKTHREGYGQNVKNLLEAVVCWHKTVAFLTGYSRPLWSLLWWSINSSSVTSLRSPLQVSLQSFFWPSSNRYTQLHVPLPQRPHLFCLI